MKKISLIVFSLLVMLVLAACGSDSSSESGTSDSEGTEGSEETTSGSGESSEFDLVEDGKLSFASSGEFKPFSYMEGNEMVGFDVAVGEAVAEKLGLEPEPVRAKFSGIVTGVTEGRYDIAVASHTITDERAEKVDFSTPYYYSGPVVYTRTDSDIESEEDLEGKEIAVARGTTYLETAEEYTDNTPQVDSDVVALQSLASGHHDAVITDDITGMTAIENGLEIEGRVQLGVSEQAIAVNKEDTALLEAINEALQEMIDSGELQQLSEEWVGVDITQEPEAAE